MELYYDIRIPDTGKEFEMLTQKVCERIFYMPFEPYGFEGQKQNGIDLHSNGRRICVQCKKYTGYDARKRLLDSVEKDFLSAVSKFGHEMEKYVLATTVQRDTQVQDLVFELSKRHSIEIQVLFWDDFQRIFKEHPEIIAEHRSSEKTSPTYTLVVERNGNSICLDRASVDSLKSIYREFKNRQRYPISVDLRIKDYDDLAVLRERDDLRKNYGDDFAKYEASQTLRKKYRANKDAYNTAIEYMLQDEMLDSCALLERQRYVDEYGLAACSYKDEYGIFCDYWTVFLWIEIVTEMVEELIVDRYYKYGNDRSMTAIDCCARTRQGNDLWYFVSYLSNDQCDKKDPDILRKLRWAGCDYFDIPRSELIAHVYPDFFLNIGLLKSNHTQRFEELVRKNAKVFNLYHYTFGLH